MTNEKPAARALTAGWVKNILEEDIQLISQMISVTATAA